MKRCIEKSLDIVRRLIGEKSSSSGRREDLWSVHNVRQMDS